MLWASARGERVEDCLCEGLRVVEVSVFQRVTGECSRNERANERKERWGIVKRV